MIDLDQCTPELLVVAKTLQRVPVRCLRDPIALVEWHSALAKQIVAVAKTLTPAALVKVRRKLPPFETGTIRGPTGRLVSVERRRRRA